MATLVWPALVHACKLTHIIFTGCKFITARRSIFGKEHKQNSTITQEPPYKSATGQMRLFSLNFHCGERRRKGQVCTRLIWKEAISGQIKDSVISQIDPWDLADYDRIAIHPHLQNITKQVTACNP
jgi:hypothetical protein